MFKHIPVMLDEVIESLNVDKDKIYVDATIGGGGHSEEILKILSGGKGFLIGIDQDADAIEACSDRLKKYIDAKKLIIVKNNFENIDVVLDDLNVKKVAGALFDLGVSSFQFDEGSRGFSYNKDARLDMRMDKDNPLTCEKVVNEYDAKELSRIIREYGEENFASSIADKIVSYRSTKKIETTYELVDIIKSAIPAKYRYGDGKEKNPAKRTFQAFRVYINRELEVIDLALDKIIDRLDENGRLVVITFQSLEDKLVKDKFKTFESPCTCPKGYPCVCGKKSKGKMVSKKVIRASSDEIENNRRSRPAKLRIFERGKDAN